MAMGTERSEPLHNFTLPCGLKWGNQKFLRCVKVQSNGQISTVHRRQHRSNPNDDDDDDDGIEAVREKLTFDLQTESDKIKHVIFKKSFEERLPVIATADVSDVADLSRPCNLRTRRAACKEPIGFVRSMEIDVNRTNNGLTPLIRTENKSPRLRIGGAGGSSSGEKRQRVKFSVAVSRSEIEEDFMAMVGRRPPRRPKKRAKFVQKNLDTLFPGLWLTEITPDIYKVSEDQ